MSDTAVARHRPLVLHADEHVDTRDLLQAMLQPYGVSVVGVESGKDAYEAALSLRPDLVVTELRLPQLDGYSLIERLKANEWFRHVPIVAWTASADAASTQRAAAVGCDHVLLKAGASNAVEQIVKLLGPSAHLV